MIGDTSLVLRCGSGTGEHALQQDAQGAVGVWFGLSGHLVCGSFVARGKGDGGRL